MLILKILKGDDVIDYVIFDKNKIESFVYKPSDTHPVCLFMRTVSGDQFYVAEVIDYTEEFTKLVETMNLYIHT